MKVLKRCFLQWDDVVGCLLQVLQSSFQTAANIAYMCECEWSPHVNPLQNTESYHVGRVEVEGVPVPDGLVLPGRGRGLARHVEAGGDRQRCLLASAGVLLLLLLLCEAGFVGLEPLVAGASVIGWRSLKGVWLYKQIYSVHKIFVSTVNIDILFLFSRWHTIARK